MNEIFLSEYNAVFEDNGTTGWFYLLDEETDEIIADCWLYNRIEAPENIESYKGSAPPAAKGFASENSQIENPDEKNFSFLWSADGKSVAILFDKVPLGYIKHGEKFGCSKNLLQSSGWGNVFDEEEFERVFVQESGE